MEYKNEYKFDYESTKYLTKIMSNHNFLFKKVNKL